MLKWRMLRMFHQWFPQHVFCTIFVSSSMMGQLKISLMMMMTKLLFQFQGHMVIGNYGGSGLLTAKISKGKYEAKLEIPGGY